MMTLQDKLVQIAEKADKHIHDYVVSVYQDTCGEWHLDEWDLEEDKPGVFTVTLPPSTIYCWRCNITLEETQQGDSDLSFS